MRNRQRRCPRSTAAPTWWFFPPFKTFGGSLPMKLFSLAFLYCARSTPDVLTSGVLRAQYRNARENSFIGNEPPNVLKGGKNHQVGAAVDRGHLLWRLRMLKMNVFQPQLRRALLERLLFSSFAD